MCFDEWQPRYAEHRVATFPVRVDAGGKKPAIRGWQRVGLAGSGQLGKKFASANAFGFCPGKSSGLTILDVDTSDDCVLAAALDRHGQTPIIVRSGSGNFQAWYRWNGERRRIRPESDKPIDILGSGFVVAPPSRGTKANYQFIQGGLEDLDRLPTLSGIEAAPPAPFQLGSVAVGLVTEGNRNNYLWRHCMKSAGHCDDFDTLLDVAFTRNAEFSPPLPEGEVVKTATSAWDYTKRGVNWFGSQGAWLTSNDLNRLVSDPEVLALVSWLRAENRPNSEFWIADGLAKKIGWSLHRLREARRRAIIIGEIKLIQNPKPGRPAVYVFGNASGIRR